jgi:sarcosine oxidase
MTTPPHDFAVIGRGLMGTACARHLAEAGHSVVLIGPDEPKDPTAFTGPFGSFHDAGRITRRIADDPVWADLSAKAMARYAALETRSRIKFFEPRGCMMSGPSTGPAGAFMKSVLAACNGHPHDVLEGDALAARMPMFRFAPGTRAAYDVSGGIIDPRAMREAEEVLAKAAGAHVIAAPVRSIAQSAISLETGGSLSVGHTILATGAYANTTPLTPRRPKMTVYQRTIAFAEVSQAEALRLADMPSLIFWPDGGATDLYLLPPIRYPDGKFYLKIGGEGQSPIAATSADLTQWFQSGGSAEAGQILLAHLQRVMPELAIKSTHTGACAVSFTATGYPYIERLSGHLTLLTGGNGAGAKCADELGRLAMLAATSATPNSAGYDCDFHAEFH